MKTLASYNNSIPASADLPFGAFKNETAQGQNDGTKIVAEHMQDLYYGLYSILQLAGFAPNGTLENGNAAKQFLAALSNVGIIKHNDTTTYYIGQLVYSLFSGVITFYKSIVADNHAALSDTDSWLPLIRIDENGKINFLVETNINLDYDFINQSKAMTTGGVSSNAVVYADIFSRYCSSFDITNFTVVGLPTITGGIAGGFSASNYIAFSAVQLGNYSNWKLEFEFNTSGTVTGFTQRVFCLTKNVYYNGVMLAIDSSGIIHYSIGSNVNNAVDDIVSYTETAVANKKYFVTIEFTGTAYVGAINGVEAFNVTSSAVCGNSLNTANIGQATSNYFIGQIDLKKFVIYGNGNIVFSGMNRGSDSYTIGGNTVTIPYTLTSGGAKIADYASLSDIQDVFNAGFTDEQYFTIDEDNQQFTLPQGMSVYEGICNKANKSLSNINADGINDIFVYNQPADTYTTLTLGASGATYMATDNGFYVLRALGSSFRMYMDNGFGVEPSSTSASINVTGVLPVRKGQSITIDYTIMNVVFFIFIKARGV